MLELLYTKKGIIMAGYHLYTITKGQLGKYSKVIEEFTEFTDAIEQDCSIMALVELSDLIGSIKSYFYENNKETIWNKSITNLLENKYQILPVDYADLLESFDLTRQINHINHWERLVAFIEEIDHYVHQYNLSIRDLIRMSHITERAFTSGQRKSA